MLYEIAWLFFTLGIAIFLSIGLLGLFFSPAIPGRTILKEVAVVLSVLIIVTSIYFSYKWNAGKSEIQAMGQQVELALKKYLTANKK